MRRFLALAVALTLPACQFSLRGLSLGGGPADAGGGDLARPGGQDAGGPKDASAGDLSSDPCAGGPLPGAVVTAECTIGAPPAIDGDLGDWPPALFTGVVQHRSAGYAEGTWDPMSNEDNDDKNLSASFALRWDAQALYLAFQITDDKVGTAGSGIYNDDAVELYFDGDESRTNPYDADDLQLILSEDGLRAAYHYNGVSNSVNLPAGIASAVKQGPGADWTLEVEVPWSVLGGQVAPGRLLGFDVQLDDNDGGPTRQRALVWMDQPSACTCSTGVCEPWCSTDMFVTLQLGNR